MTLTKTDIADSIYNQCGFSRMKSDKVVEAILETMKSTLESGENVLLSGFGKFSVREKSARRGRDPATGKDLTLEGRRVVTFRSSPVLRPQDLGALNASLPLLQALPSCVPG
jgi:integration host factor subunit alpha